MTTLNKILLYLTALEPQGGSFEAKFLVKVTAQQSVSNEM